jgi:hypothetical protein
MLGLWAIRKQIEIFLVLLGNTFWWGGVSILPGLLVMPIAATLIALLINLKWSPVGFWVVGLLHACYGIWALGYVLYAVIYMKRYRKKP